MKKFLPHRAQMMKTFCRILLRSSDEPPASSIIFGNEQDNEDQKSEDSDSENEDSGDEERDKLALPTNEDDIEVSDIVVSM